MCRGADVEDGLASERMCPCSAHPGGEPTEALRDAALESDRKKGTAPKFCHISPEYVPSKGIRSLFLARTINSMIINNPVRHHIGHGFA